MNEQAWKQFCACFCLNKVYCPIIYIFVPRIIYIPYDVTGCFGVWQRGSGSADPEWDSDWSERTWGREADKNGQERTRTDK